MSGSIKTDWIRIRRLLDYNYEQHNPFNDYPWMCVRKQNKNGGGDVF